ncbi:MAG TPA: bluetail domain-containing putative surface protein, partial [Rhizomicrobium sp.]|nr:bluetail domain-containing putative surface protein [Rhizomicrobium sp.]
DLEIGLFGGIAQSSGFSTMSFTVSVNGAALISQTFPTAAAAVTYFSNHAIDLASLASGNTLTVTISDSITMTGANQGFVGGFLIGDPPSGSGSTHATQPHGGSMAAHSGGLLLALLDRFDHGVTGTDTKVASGALSHATFDSDLASAINASHLEAHHAVLFTPSSGDLKGHTFMIVDHNGVAGYQAGHDAVFDLTTGHAVNDFV